MRCERFNECFKEVFEIYDKLDRVLGELEECVKLSEALIAKCNKYRKDTRFKWEDHKKTFIDLRLWLKTAIKDLEEAQRIITPYNMNKKEKVV